MPASTPRGVPYPLATDPLSAFPADVAQPLAGQVDTLMGTLTTHGTHLDELDETTQAQGLSLETLSSAVTSHGTQLDALPATIDARIAGGLAPGGAIKAADDASLASARSYADSGLAQLSTWFLRGNGSPVGVVTPSSAGVQYVDRAATNGARIWISTGTTASAWRVVDGDTGWRNILTGANAAYFNTGAGSNLLIRRTQSEVDLFAVLQTTSDISADVSILNTGALPQGFTLLKTASTIREVFRLGIRQARFNVSREPSVRVSPGSDAATIPTGDTLRFTLIWPGSTDDTAWPTTLPGTPA